LIHHFWYEYTQGLIYESPLGQLSGSSVWIVVMVLDYCQYFSHGPFMDIGSTVYYPGYRGYAYSRFLRDFSYGYFLAAVQILPPSP
jgi:hypothetical protein